MKSHPMIYWILALSILTGQLIKIPLGGERSGGTLLDLTLISIVLFGLWKLKLKLSQPPLFIKAGLLFILVTILSLILSPLNLNFNEYLISFFYIVRFSLLILLGWIILSGGFNDLKKNIYSLLILTGISLSILGLLQFIFIPDLMFLQKYGWDPHYFRTVSTFLDPNFTGAYLVLTIILLIQNVMIRRGWKILFVIVYLALLTTFSRGAYLAFLVSFTSFAILNKSIKIALITTLLFMGLMLGFNTYQKIIAHPRNVDRKQSAESRLGTWQQGFKLFQSNPILGVGFNSYKFALRQYHFADEQFLKSHGSSSNDSSLLYVAATTGSIGLISYVFFLISIFITGIRTHPQLSAGLIGISAQSFFANTLFYPHLLLWIILVAVYFEDKTSS